MNIQNNFKKTNKKQENSIVMRSAASQKSLKASSKCKKSSAKHSDHSNSTKRYERPELVVSNFTTINVAKSQRLFQTVVSGA